VKDDKGGNGLFFNYEDYFMMTCPTCGHSLKFGAERSEAVREALTAWCTEPDRTPMQCPACKQTTSVREWRSSTDTFAAGHLAFTLWGAYVTALFEKPPPRAGAHLRHLIGDFAEDYAVIFCHI
jgi:hypothetical protein